jgi:hypothetical protein
VRPFILLAPVVWMLSMKPSFLSITPLFCLALTAQADDVQTPSSHNPVQLSAYLESYLIHDFNDPANNRRPGFVYSHNITDSPSINLAMLKAALTTDRVRGNLALGSGTYMRANYAAEPHGLRNIYEANLGLKLSSEHDLWLDIGVMPSHIGFESAIGMDNWTLTRSLMADNSPYFETGAKLTYTTEDGKWLVSGLLLTGWQRIHRPDGNTTPAIGHQLTYKPSDKLTINSSSFIGNDKSDAQRQMRYFHDFYVQWQLNEQWGLITALDIGAEQAAPGSDRYNVWFSPNMVLRYTYSDQLQFAARLEHYRDKHGVIISTGTDHGFQTTGYSVNMDYRLNTRMVWRNELRQLNSRDAIFDKNGSRLVDNNLMAVTALTISF